MSTVQEVRSKFLSFFQENGHEVVSSSSLVPKNDPTLLFTNAGMVQFKDVFTGLEKRDYSRAVTTQKCVRAGGKHNDLENVGYTARHHTFFEMLGNFSFGDYFKEEAIELAWKLITKEYGLPKDKLLVTVFHEDDEAFDLWKKIAGLGNDKIIRISTSDNFWSMGELGPCGPCSEIFYDHGDHIPGGPPGSPDEDGDRFIEIWNLVFMQFEQVSKDKRISLPKPSIDTGMGLERVSAVLQGKHDNYDTDLFQKIISQSSELLNKEAVGSALQSHRVIADHLRSSSFLIADGVLPSNEGRGYVLRRIMRRAMRHIHMLEGKEPMMYKLVPTLSELMGDAFPELRRAQALISETLKLEETRFKKTLQRGLKLLDEEAAKLSEGDSFSGEVAFKLYDTYGFPVDLTEDVLRSEGIGVDLDAFEKSMEKQRENARQAWVGSGETKEDVIWFDLKQKLAATEFLGYESVEAQATLLALLKDGKEIKTANHGDCVSFIVNQTPFYAESGGQIGDKGTVTTEKGAVLQINDTLKKGDGLFVHYADVVKGDVSLGETFFLKVDVERRNFLRAHHSATHLLHEALRRVLGDHVTQKGSLVAPDRLRFDFSHPKALTKDELNQIETIVNQRIWHNEPVQTQLLTPDEAVEEGALALFGEKYGDEVRVVSMGGQIDSLDKKKNQYSVELCGGTHVSRTGDIGLLKIIQETSVAAGVRRIEAVASRYAFDYLAQKEDVLKSLAVHLKTSEQKINERVLSLLEEKKSLENALKDARKSAISGGDSSDKTPVKRIGDLEFVALKLQDIPAKELKSMADNVMKSLEKGIVAIASSNDGKASLVVSVSQQVLQGNNIDAVQLVRVGSVALGGKGGGGRPDMAQAGGPDVNALDKALNEIEKNLEKCAA